MLEAIATIFDPSLLADAFTYTLAILRFIALDGDE